MNRLFGLALALAAVLALVPAAVAAPPTPVDPATLTPPPSTNFDWSCASNGQGIRCSGVQEFGAVAVNPDPAFACGDRLIEVTFTQIETAHRFHDAEGRVTRVQIVGTFDEVWRLEGTSSPELTSRGRWHLTIDYAIPGQIESRTVTSAGNALWVTAPGTGLVLQHSGVTVLNWDESGILKIHGTHDFLEDFGGAIDAACRALGA